MERDNGSSMEFLVTIQNNLPMTMLPEERTKLFADESARASELALNGSIQRLWRIAGRRQNVGIWCASSADELHEMLTSLPMFPFLDITVTPLALHPSDPGIRPRGLRSRSGDS